MFRGEDMKELIDLQRTLHVPKDKDGYDKKYKYRKADDILEAVKKHAPANVYVIMTDDIVSVGAFNYMKGTATIYNGTESISASSFAKEGKLAAQSDPQISGSCSTYARKKALEGLFMLDDGNDPDDIKPGEIKPDPDDTKVISPDQYKLLLKCVDMLEKNGFPDKAKKLKPMVKENLMYGSYEGLYNTACNYLGEKVVL
jgi:hypothetical protein